MKKKLKLRFLVIILIGLFLCACGDKDIIDVSIPDASTEWTSLQGAHPVKWENAKAMEHVFLYKGEEKLFELPIYISDDGDVIVRHPKVEPGSGYRIKIEDEKANFGYSEAFKIIK